ncbi:FadR family transcriptional regulator [Bacillus sp. FJAT-49732]|uniref:FadR family transcriptional regulator n=1 Tax=Lederbergia citrisecunda TaxID=2833583 RepID=A0A942TR48_9BACI|nr:FadR/GntR family transcriptional regulator [Lederbergia citrisecunda]MBS4202210.1 FadR family transcriptional regulator [Lederbergia citrisecunda]
MLIQRKQTLSEVVSERIKSYISENKCLPGDRLPTEKEIIEMLGVSRTIVREALKTLQSQGIIEIKQGLGIFVKEIKIQSILRKISPFLTIDKIKFKEVIESRIILELGAIDLAINHYDIEKIKQMSFWNEALLEKAKVGEKPKKEDLNFHRSLMNATGNETFIQLSSIITEYFNMNHLEEIVDLEQYVASYKEHQSVIDSILKKDVDKAKQSMETHLHHLYDLLDDWEE